MYSGIVLSQIENAGDDDDDDVPISATATNAKSSRLSPVLSLAVHSEAVWGLSGVSDGRIQLFTIRHDQGTVVHALSRHTDQVSVLQLSHDEHQAWSGGWDRQLLVRSVHTLFS